MNRISTPSTSTPAANGNGQNKPTNGHQHPAIEPATRAAGRAAAAESAAVLSFFDLLRAFTFEHAAKLSAREIRAWLALFCYRNNQTGTTFVSVATVAKAVSDATSRGNAQAALTALAKAGYAPVVDAGGGRGRSSVRLVTLPGAKRPQNEGAPDSKAVSAKAPPIQRESAPNSEEKRPRFGQKAPPNRRHDLNMQLQRQLQSNCKGELPCPASPDERPNTPHTSQRAACTTLAEVIASLDDPGDQHDAKWLSAKGVTVDAIDHLYRTAPLEAPEIVSTLAQKENPSTAMLAWACRHPDKFKDRQRKYNDERAGNDSDDDGLPPAYLAAINRRGARSAGSHEPPPTTPHDETIRRLLEKRDLILRDAGKAYTDAQARKVDEALRAAEAERRAYLDDPMRTADMTGAPLEET